MSKYLIAAYLFLAIACFSDHSLAQNQCTSVWQEDIRPEILNPYTLEHSLKSQLKDTSGLLTQIEARKLNLLLSQQQNPEVLSQIDTWVKSDVHALYLYDRIQSSQNEALKPTLQWLNDYNPFFQNTFPILQITGTFLTFGFEKEGFSPDIAYFYKNPNTSDNQWFSLSQENQVSELKKLTAAKKSFLSAKYIAPTALKPEFLDGYSEELATSHNNNRKWGWEIRHKKYEINFERFFNQITEITQSFKETHSLHSHLVFELPINYKFFEQFQGWSKWVNDYLVLKGMEEGLHPNALTSIANRPQKLSLWLKIKEFFWGESAPHQLPRNLEEIKKTNFKFLSMGIRAEMYGPATTKENKKIGLEFRDITRDLVLLKSILSKAAKSVSEFSWEKVSKLKYFGTQSDRSISIHKNRSLIELESFLGKEFALYFDKITPSLQLALTKYEYGKYIDYRRGELFLPTKDQATRIVEARKYFIEELIKIKQNLIDMKNRGESFEKEDVDLAIKMTLSEWAKMARASELFGRY